MAETLVTTLNIAFDDDNDGLGDHAGKNRIVLQQVTKRMVNGVLAARCFPSTGVRFRASVGSVEEKEERSWQAWEAIKFSDSSEGQLKFPGATNVVFNFATMVLMKKVTNQQGHVTIEEAPEASVVWDATNEKVLVQGILGVPLKVYGACFVSYDAFYRMLYYRPNTQTTSVGGGNYQFNWTTGTIFGYNDYTVETLDMELDIKDPPEWVEFARVTSKIVLTPDGVSEYPPNWESTYDANQNVVNPKERAAYNTGTFDGFSSDYDIDPDQSFTDERVHCIVTVNSMGTVRYEDFNNGGSGYWAWNPPYFGNSTYHPDYEGKKTAPPGGDKAGSAEDFRYDVNNRTWRDVFLEVDIADIKDRLSRQYPGIVYTETRSA
jgi:hypothetical protein